MDMQAKWDEKYLTQLRRPTSVRCFSSNQQHLSDIVQTGCQKMLSRVNGCPYYSEFFKRH